MPDKASVGVAIIAKDAAKTLAKCLDSIRPYVSQIVVCVDQRTTDTTAKIARKHGAVTFPIQVSDWHECAQHGRVLAQHFAQARQESFTHLDPTLDFWLWIDSDDTFEGAEYLAKACAECPADAVGIWMPYEYASIERADGVRKVNTLFHRERLLRTHIDGLPVTWTWQGRVHETVAPDIKGAWVVAEDMRIVHQPGTHDTPASATRNLLLLEIDYEDDPESARTVFYMGNQHFAMGNWKAAVDWYELLCSGLGTNPYELWQAYLYMSLAYERLGDLTSAAQAAYGAMDCRPEHGEPYFRIAAICQLSGEHEKAVFWNKLGRQMKEPPFFVFKNPLDYSFNQRVVQGEAYMALGRVTEARKEWEAAAETFTDERLMGALENAAHREQTMKQAQAFVELAGAMDGQVIPLYEALPDEVKAFGRTRDVVMPVLRGSLARAGPRIVFYCGNPVEPWAPPVLNTTGIGGSETAVIQIARLFAADSWHVDVFNGAERYEGIYEGVGYWDLKRYNSRDRADVFVSWRQPKVWQIAPAGAKKILWCHDLNYGPGLTNDMRHFDHVLGVSAWHAGMLHRYYGVDADFVPNGIDLSRFDPTVKKVPFRCVYASSADRGLNRLLDLWPLLTAAEPTAELHIAYGWETIDRMIEHGRTDLIDFREKTTAMIANTSNVVFRGRLPQDELARLYGESAAWLYPCDFLEVSCISAMEAMAGGAVPVVTRAGALPETIGEAGLLVPGPPQSRAFGDLWPKAAIGVLLEANTRLTYAKRGRERAKGFTWDAAYEKWRTLLGADSYRLEPGGLAREPVLA